MLRKTLMAGLVAAALAPSVGLAADAPAAPASPHTFTGNIGLYSQYVFRGLTQTDRDPALQGGFDYAHSSGFYAGTWASNISWLRDGTPPAYASGGSLEWDFYGGYKMSLPYDLGLDLGTLYYLYPGSANPADTRNPKAHTWEAYAALSWKWLSAKYSYSLSNKTFGVLDSRGTWYLDFSANLPLGEFYKPLDGFTFTAHYGIQEYRGTDPRTAPMTNDQVYSYEDWKIGVSYALPKDFTIGVFYTDTSGTSIPGYGSTAQGGPYPRPLGKGAGTVFIQKTF